MLQGGQLGPNSYEDLKGKYVLVNGVQSDLVYFGRDRQGNHLLTCESQYVTRLETDIDVSSDAEVQSWWGTPAETARLFGSEYNNSYPYRCATGLINNYNEIVDEIYGEGEYSSMLEECGDLVILIKLCLYMLYLRIVHLNRMNSLFGCNVKKAVHTL